MPDHTPRCSLRTFVHDSLASNDDWHWLGISFWELQEGPGDELAGMPLIRESIALLRVALEVLGSNSSERLFPYVSFCLPETTHLQKWSEDLLALAGWGDSSLNLCKYGPAAAGQPFFWGVAERYSRKISLAFLDSPDVFAIYSSYTGEDRDGYANRIAIFPDYWYSKSP